MHANNGALNLFKGGRTDALPSTARVPLRVPDSMPASEARVVLSRAGQAIALVTHHGVDSGVVTAQDLVSDGVTPDASIGDVMRHEIVNIDPSTDLRRTVRAYREAAWFSAIRRHPGEGEGHAHECHDR